MTCDKWYYQYDNVCRIQICNIRINRTYYSIIRITIQHSQSSITEVLYSEIQNFRVTTI